MGIYSVDKIVAEARRVAREYREATGKTLPITAEIAVNDAIRLLGLSPANPGEQGFDAAMTEQKVEINRTLVGVLTLGCFSASLLIWLCWPDEDLWYAGFLRVGLLLMAFWLALPSRGRDAAWARVSPWTLVGAILVLIALSRVQLRIIIPLLIAITVIGYFVRPRAKRRPRPPS